jgi:hypothetical protein
MRFTGMSGLDMLGPTAFTMRRRYNAAGEHVFGKALGRVKINH